MGGTLGTSGFGMNEGSDEAGVFYYYYCSFVGIHPILRSLILVGWPHRLSSGSVFYQDLSFSGLCFASVLPRVCLLTTGETDHVYVYADLPTSFNNTDKHPS